MQTFIKNNEASSQLLIKNSKLLLNNQFQFIHPFDMEPCREIVNLSEDIDWTSVPFDDDEWNFMLNRQEYLMDLCVAFEKEHEIKYLEKGKELILDWISKNDTEDNWRTIDTGIRLVYWKILIDYLLKEGLLAKEELNLISQSVTQQLIYLDSYYIEKYDLSNWGVLITAGYFIIQLLFKENVSKEMNERMLKRLEKQMYLQVQPSGNHWEQSPLYFMEVLRSFVFLHVSNAVIDKKIKQQLEQTILSMYQFMPHFMTPEKHSILQGDTDEMFIDDTIQTIALLYNCSIPTLFMNRVAVDYPILHLSGKEINFNDWKEGTKNLSNKDFANQLADDYTGNYFYRNNWTEQSDYLHLYNGSLGSGHGHLSLGHIDLAMDGVNLLVDSGRYTYVESDIRRKLKESAHHNTATINERPFGVVKDSWGYEKVPTSLFNRFVDTDNYVAIRSVYLDNQDTVTFKVVRTVVYFKDEKDFLIIDQVIEPGTKSFEKMSRHFHLRPGLEICVDKDSSRVLLADENNNQFYACFSESQIEVIDTEYAPLYNELIKSKKIKTSNTNTCQYLLLTQSDKTELTEVNIRKSDSKPVLAEKCFGIHLKKGDSEYLIHSAIEDTFEGHKLYVLNEFPVYGQLSIHKINKKISEYTRLM